MLPLELQKENIKYLIHPLTNIFMNACFVHETLFHDDKERIVTCDYSCDIYHDIECDDTIEFVTSYDKNKLYSIGGNIFDRFTVYPSIIGSDEPEEDNLIYDELLLRIEKYDNLFSVLDNINKLNYFDFDKYGVTLYDMYRAVDFPIKFKKKIKITDQMKRNAYTEFVRCFINSNNVDGFGYDTCLDYLKHEILSSEYLGCLYDKIENDSFNLPLVMDKFLDDQVCIEFSLKYLRKLIEQIYRRINILSKFPEFQLDCFHYNFNDIVNGYESIKFDSRDFKDTVLKLLRRNDWDINKALNYLFTDIEVIKKEQVIDKYKPIHRFHNKPFTFRDLNKL